MANKPTKKMPANFQKSIVEGRHQLQYKTPEERHAFTMKSVEARRKKKQEQLAMQKCMQALLLTDVNSRGKKKILKDYGFEDEYFNNQSLVILALFKKALTGDISAIKEIVAMQDKLDESKKKKTVEQESQSITINLIPKGKTFEMSKEDEEDIRKAEEGIPIEMDTDKDTDSWDTDDESLYNGWDEEDIYNG